MFSRKTIHDAVSQVAWSERELRWRDALMAAVVAGAEKEDLPPLSEIESASFWDEYQNTAPSLLRFGFRFSVWALNWSPPLVVGRRTTFVGLDGEERDRFLTMIASSDIYLVRQLLFTIKVMACLAYFRDERVRDRIDHAEQL